MLFDDTTDRAPTIRETATTQSTLCLKLPDAHTHSFAIRHAPPINAMWRPVIHRTNHTMTHQAGTTTKAPRQCSECQETSNGRPTLLSDVLRERHLAVNESPHQHEHAMRRLDRPHNPTIIPPTATTQPKQGDCRTHTRRNNCAIRLASPIKGGR